MERPSSTSPSWERRRAWARRTRHWHTTVDEADAAAALQDVPELSERQLDDVFLQGSPANKIRSWLQHCGSSVENLPEETYLPVTSGAHSHVNSFDDDLTLGAEAMLLPGIPKTTTRKSLDKASCSGFLQLGNSMASSGVSSWTNKTGSSVTEILELCQEDPESILYNLGFAAEQPPETTRIPARFFQVPSQMKGINFRLFLEAQVQRMEMEDPCVQLANRFKQVETLTTTANAFYCLYSYVSKTPVQKIASSNSFVDYGDIPDIMITSPRPQPGSPIERLKRAVSRMCLYSPSRDRALPPKGNLDAKRNLSKWDMVVKEVLDKVREDKLKGEQKDNSASKGQDKALVSAGQLLVSHGKAETSAASMNALKSEVSEAGALPISPTQGLHASRMTDQPVRHMKMVQALEERSSPTGPKMRLKCQHKLYFFPEEDLSLRQHEWDAGEAAVETSIVSTEAVKTWPTKEALPIDSYVNFQSASNTENHLEEIKANDDTASVHTQTRGLCSDSWSSTLCKGVQSKYQEHNGGFQPLFVSSSKDTNLTETVERNLVHVICEDKNGTDHSGSASGSLRDFSEDAQFRHTTRSSWAATGATQPSDSCRDTLTTLSVGETNERKYWTSPTISGPIFSNGASRRYQGIVESASFDHSCPSEKTWTLYSAEETSLSRRTCQQDNSFDMEEIQSNEGDHGSIIENTSTPLSAVKCRRKRFSLNADSTQSGSSGFIDDFVLECMTQVLDLQQTAPSLGGHFKT